MTTSEAARHDLYNGLTDLLGPQRAETLMSALPPYDPTELVTKTDLVRFGAELRAELRSDFKTELQEGLTALNRRVDQLFIAWVGGLIVIVGAMAGVVFMP